MADTGAVLCGTGANADRDGNPAWTNTSNITVGTDAAGASVNPDKLDYSDWLRATNFDFSAIGGSDTINGIEVTFRRNASYAEQFEDSAIYLRTSAGQSGNNKASGTKWDSAKVTVVYGSSSDMWGTSYTATDIKDSSFGVDLSVHRNPGGGSSVNVYWVKITIYYTPAASGYGNDVFGVSSASISKVFGVETANIDKVFGA